jgi:hypothetical protein
MVGISSGIGTPRLPSKSTAKMPRYVNCSTNPWSVSTAHCHPRCCTTRARISWRTERVQVHGLVPRPLASPLIPPPCTSLFRMKDATTDPLLFACPGEVPALLKRVVAWDAAPKCRRMDRFRTHDISEGLQYFGYRMTLSRERRSPAFFVWDSRGVGLSPRSVAAAPQHSTTISVS